MSRARCSHRQRAAQRRCENGDAARKRKRGGVQLSQSKVAWETGPAHSEGLGGWGAPTLSHFCRKSRRTRAGQELQSPKLQFSMSTDPLLEARREARGEAILFVVVTMALLIVLAVTSLLADWELIGLPGWLWFALCVPEAVLIGGLFLSAQVGDDSATVAGCRVSSPWSCSATSLDSWCWWPACSPRRALIFQEHNC